MLLLWQTPMCCASPTSSDLSKEGLGLAASSQNAQGPNRGCRERLEKQKPPKEGRQSVEMGTQRIPAGKVRLIFESYTPQT